MTELWHWPQWVMACCYVLGIFLSATLHGRQRTGEHNVLGHLIRGALMAWVLHEGGFW